MRLWIEDDNGNRVECEEIKTVNVPDSILVFETAKKLTKSCIDDFRKCIKEQTGHPLPAPLHATHRLKKQWLKIPGQLDKLHAV